MQLRVAPPFWHPASSKAFILDWDGVLADTRLDFKPLRAKYFGGRVVPLIEATEALAPELRREVEAEIRRVEMEGAENATAVAGAKDLIGWLNANGKPWAVVSRNCRDSILLAAERCGISLPSVLLSREDPHIKPEPEALALAAKRLKVNLSSCVMVGDFVYDLLGARRAAIRAVLVQRGGEDWEHLADVAYRTVEDFVTSLASPLPLVPWEYRDLAERQGEDYLRDVSSRLYRLHSRRGGFQQALELGEMGVTRLSVGEDLKIHMQDWKGTALPPQAIEASLLPLLQEILPQRWPCMKIYGDADAPSDRPCIEVPALRGLELQRFLVESLQ